jgi:hypothetical protein
MIEVPPQAGRRPEGRMNNDSALVRNHHANASGAGRGMLAILARADLLPPFGRRSFDRFVLVVEPAVVDRLAGDRIGLGDR